MVLQRVIEVNVLCFALEVNRLITCDLIFLQQASCCALAAQGQLLYANHANKYALKIPNVLAFMLLLKVLLCSHLSKLQNCFIYNSTTKKAKNQYNIPFSSINPPL